MTIRDILQRRDSIRAELRTLHTGATDGALGDEAQGRWTVLEAELGTLDAQERRTVALDDLDRRAAGTPLGGSGDSRWDAMRDSVGLLAIIRAQLRDHAHTAEAGRAREVSQELARRSGRTPANGLLFDMRSAPVETRTLTTGKQGTTSNGQPLVPLIQRADLFTDILRANLVIEQSGARVLSGLTGDVAIPRRTQSVQPAFVAENQPLPLSDPAYDQLKMAPKTAGVVSEISRNMVLQSSPDAEALCRDDMAKTMAELIDRSALLGDGTGATPLGIIPQAQFSDTYPLAGAPTFDQVLEQGDNLEGAFITPTGWIVGPGVRRKLMQTARDASIGFNFIMEQPGVLSGYPLVQTGILPSGLLLLGDFSNLIVGYWSAVEIVVNEFAQDAFMKGNVLVRAIVTMDVQVRHKSAFTVLRKAAS